MLHRVLSRHLGPFLEQARTPEGQGVPHFVERELRRFIACGDLRRGFARVHCDDCRQDRDPMVARPAPSERRLHAHVEGFDLHAAVAIDADDRDALERLCRYLNRPAIAQDHLEQLDTGRVRVELRRPWSNGTTHLDFTPHELIARLAAFVPRPRVNLVLYHGVFAPNAKLRRAVVDYGGEPPASAPQAEDPTTQTKASPGCYWAWAELMRRTFGIDVLECPECGGRMRVLATITDPKIVGAILDHLGSGPPAPPPPPPPLVH